MIHTSLLILQQTKAGILFRYTATTIAQTLLNLPTRGVFCTHSMKFIASPLPENSTLVQVFSSKFLALKLKQDYKFCCERKSTLNPIISVLVYSHATEEYIILRRNLQTPCQKIIPSWSSPVSTLRSNEVFDEHQIRKPKSLILLTTLLNTAEICFGFPMTFLYLSHRSRPLSPWQNSTCLHLALDAMHGW